MKRQLLSMGLFAVILGASFNMYASMPANKEVAVITNVVQPTIKEGIRYENVTLKSINKATHELVITLVDGEDVIIKLNRGIAVKNSLNNTKVDYLRLVIGKKIKVIQTMNNNVATFIEARILPPFNY